MWQQIFKHTCAILIISGSWCSFGQIISIKYIFDHFTIKIVLQAIPKIPKSK